jgi:hypothetical protein
VAEYAFALAAKVSFHLGVLLGEQASEWRQIHLIGDTFLVSNLIICLFFYLVATSKMFVAIMKKVMVLHCYSHS